MYPAAMVNNGKNKNMVDFIYIYIYIDKELKLTEISSMHIFTLNILRDIM